MCGWVILYSEVNMANARKSAIPSPAVVANNKTETELKHNENINIAYNGLRETAKRLRTEDKVRVSISPLYAPEFSESMCVAINGSAIYVPCDGQTYEVPESYAIEINRRIAAADEKARKGNNMANIANNFEQFAGANSNITRG